MEPQTYEIKCGQCQAVLGQSSLENHKGFLCQTCHDEIQLADALKQGKNFDPSHLVTARPERVKEIVKAALLENPEDILGLAFNEHIENAKTEIQSDLKINDLSDEKKVEALKQMT